MSWKKKTIYLIWMGLNIVLNLYPLGKIDLLRENLSYLGYPMNHPFYLGIWGIFNGISFYLLSKNVWNHFSIQYNHAILVLSAFFMAISCLIPYTQTENLFLDNLHIHMAMAGTIIYVFLWIVQLFDPLNFLRTKYVRIYKWVMLVIAAAALPSAYTGAVSGFSELIFSFFLISRLLLVNYKI